MVSDDAIRAKIDEVDVEINSLRPQVKEFFKLIDVKKYLQSLIDENE